MAEISFRELVERDEKLRSLPEQFANVSADSKHLIDGERHTLIVVSTQENAEQAKEIDDHVAPLFSDLGVRLVRPHDADAFANEVEESFRQARSSPLAG